MSFRSVFGLSMILTLLLGTGAFAQEIIPLPDHGRVSIEGSAKFGGLQPDFVIANDDVALAKYLDEVVIGAARLRNPVAKIRFALKKVNQALAQSPYNDPTYLGLLKQHRDEGTSIALGEYISAGVGVCREHAFLMHLTLRKLGLNPRFVYAQTLPSIARRFSGTVDHAFNVIRHEGELYVIDSYTPQYNGLRFREFTSGTMAGWFSTAPWRNNNDMLVPAKVFQIHDFPKISVETAGLCRQALL